MKNILLVAFDCNPDSGSEAKSAYSWWKILQKYYNVFVITDIKHKKCIERRGNSSNFTYCSYVSDKTRALLLNIRAYNVLYGLFVRKVNKILRDKGIENIDLIHCLTPAGIFAYNNLYKFGKPIILGPVGGGLRIPENFEQYETTRYRLRQIYYKILKKNPKWINYYKNSSKILIGTRNVLSNLPECTHIKTIELFDTVVDTNKFKPTTKIKDSECINIIYSGLMDATKGCLLLVEAFNMLIKDGYSNIQLNMLGDGDELNNIKKIIKNEKLEEHIHLLGNVTSHEVSRHLKNADIFCLPAIKENGGTAILEAMACALPIVTSDYGGPAVSVTNECGIKIKPSDYNSYISDLKDALAYLIDNKDIRIRMGINARKRAVSEYSFESLESRIIELYESFFVEDKVLA